MPASKFKLETEHGKSEYKNFFTPSSSFFKTNFAMLGLLHWPEIRPGPDDSYLTGIQFSSCSCFRKCLGTQRDLRKARSISFCIVRWVLCLFFRFVDIVCDVFHCELSILFVKHFNIVDHVDFRLVCRNYQSCQFLRLCQSRRFHCWPCRFCVSINSILSIGI